MSSWKIYFFSADFFFPQKKLSGIALGVFRNLFPTQKYFVWFVDVLVSCFCSLRTFFFVVSPRAFVFSRSFGTVAVVDLKKTEVYSVCLTKHHRVRGLVREPLCFWGRKKKVFFNFLGCWTETKNNFLSFFFFLLFLFT